MPADSNIVKFLRANSTAALMQKALWRLVQVIYIYIYIAREREREREVHTYMLMQRAVALGPGDI